MGKLRIEKSIKDLRESTRVWKDELSWKERATLIREYNPEFEYSTREDLISLVRGKTYTGPSYLLTT